MSDTVAEISKSRERAKDLLYSCDLKLQVLIKFILGASTDVWNRFFSSRFRRCPVVRRRAGQVMCTLPPIVDSSQVPT